MTRRRQYKHRIPQLDDAAYFKQLDDQNGGCWICGRPPKTRRLAGDHNHKTGKRRALLCFICNYKLVPLIERFQLDPQRIADYFATFDA